MSFAVAIGLGLLGLALIPSVMELISAVDGRGAYFFNSAAGQSPVFDRFILLVADDEGRERIIVLSIIGFLLAVALAPTRMEKARLLGTFLFVAVVVLLYVGVDSLLDDVITRKSPSYDYLRPFNNIGKILGFKVDVKDRRSFPNLIAVILFIIGFVLLRLGRKPGGLLAVGLGLTVPLLQCVAGSAWLSDIYLGSLPIAFAVSALAVETPFIKVLGKLTDGAAAGMDQGGTLLRGLGPVWRHRRLYWRSQNVFHLEVAVKRFVAKELPAILYPDNPAPEGTVHLEVPLGGLRSVVRIATLGEKRVVLRAYPLNRRHEAIQHCNASTFLAKHQIRTPAILKFVNEPRKYGVLFVLEEFVQGRTRRARDLSNADITAVATELARMHNVTAGLWGPLDVPRIEDYAAVLLRRADRQIAKVGRGVIASGRTAELAEIQRWFHSWKKELETVRNFSLVHGKLHRDNCLFEEDGRFCLLDTTTLEWGMGASDLVVVQQSLCGGVSELVEQLQREYFAQLTPANAELCQRFLLFYEALYWLGNVQKTTKRLGRVNQRNPSKTLTHGTYAWASLRALILKYPRH